MNMLVKHLPTFVLAATFLIASPAFAQTVISTWGGANIANMVFSSEDGDAVPDGESVTRMAIGASVAFHHGAGLFALQLSGAYVQKGSSTSFMHGGVPAKLTLQTNYVEFGAFARVGLWSSDRVSGHLLAGLAMAMEASCNTGMRLGSGSPSRRDCDLNPTLTLSDLDFGPAVGGGLGVRLTARMGAEFGMLYTYGLRDLHEAGADEVGHRGLTIRSGLSFTIN